MTTTDVGNIGYSHIISKFIDLHIPIYIPFAEGGVVDLVAEFNGKLNKIQIKTTEHVHNNQYMMFRTCRQNGFHGSKKKYSNKEIDYFALYCIENNKTFLLPINKCNSNETKIWLTGQSPVILKNMRFEQDYTFEKIIKQ